MKTTHGRGKVWGPWIMVGVILVQFFFPDVMDALLPILGPLGFFDEVIVIGGVTLGSFLQWFHPTGRWHRFGKLLAVLAVIIAVLVVIATVVAGAAGGVYLWRLIEQRFF